MLIHNIYHRLIDVLRDKKNQFPIKMYRNTNHNYQQNFFTFSNEWNECLCWMNSIWMFLWQQMKWPQYKYFTYVQCTFFSAGNSIRDTFLWFHTSESRTTLVQSWFIEYFVMRFSVYLCLEMQVNQCRFSNLMLPVNVIACFYLTQNKTWHGNTWVIVCEVVQIAVCSYFETENPNHFKWKWRGKEECAWCNQFMLCRCIQKCVSTANRCEHSVRMHFSCLTSSLQSIRGTIIKWIASTFFSFAHRFVFCFETFVIT